MENNRLYISQLKECRKPEAGWWPGIAVGIMSYNSCKNRKVDGFCGGLREDVKLQRRG